MTERFTVTYHVRSDPTSIESRAWAIAVEQSVEMPLAAIDEPEVLFNIVGKVEQIDDTVWAPARLRSASVWRWRPSATIPANC
jgi:hypothetical protein